MEYDFNMGNVLAAVNTDWIGNVSPPFGGGGYASGLTPFINGVLWLVFLFFGLYALYMFVLAAYTFINSQGDPKNVEKAQKMITYSVIGLVLLVTSFMFAAIIGQVFFGSWDFVLDPAKAVECTVAEQKIRQLQSCRSTCGVLTTSSNAVKVYRQTGTAQDCTAVYEEVKSCTCP